MKLNRLDVDILYVINAFNTNNKYCGITITEIMNQSNISCTRMTVYRKLKQLVEEGYIDKGILSNHADTYSITEKVKKICERLNGYRYVE